MPTYTYKCKECKFEFDVFKKITDNSIELCPKCGGKSVKTLSVGGGIIFKGNGFYITDYKKKNSLHPSTKSTLKENSNTDTKQVDKK